MTKHTPGPWVFHDNGHCRTIDGGGRSLLGDETYYPWCPEEDADWHLIAAAPELLGLVEDWLVSFGFEETQWAVEARRIVAKAKGAKP